MKSNYPEFFDSDPAKLEALWATATFAFDASSLLDFYRLSDDTIQKYFQAIESVKDRLFLPYQADFEYSKNRKQVIGDQIALFPKVANVQAAIQTNLSVKADDHRNPLSSMLDVLQKTAELEKVLLEIETLLEQEKKCFHVRATMTDGRLDRLFGPSVAVKPDNLDAMRAIAKERYSKLMPPGYIDDKTKHAAIKQECDSPKGKVLGDPFGDAIIWQELLASPYDQLIFVTGERKADWWLEIHGKRSPRPELIREMREKGKEFYLYSVDSFIEHALNSLPKSDKPSDAGIESAVNEIRGLEMGEGDLGPTQVSPSVGMMSFYDGSGGKPFFRRIPFYYSPNSWRQLIDQCIARLFSVIRNTALAFGLDAPLNSDPLDLLQLLQLANVCTSEIAAEVRGQISYMRLRLAADDPVTSDELSYLLGWTDYACSRLEVLPFI